MMKKLEVVASPIYTVEDILADETFRERESIVTVDDPDLGPLRMQNVFPKLTNYTGSVWRSAPRLGGCPSWGSGESAARRTSACGGGAPVTLAGRV